MQKQQTETNRMDRIKWSREKVLHELLTRNAMSANADRPCPISARVVARIEGTEP